MVTKNNKILVTGGGGFIGSHLVDSLLSLGFEVCVLDDFSTGDPRNLAQHHDNKRFSLVKGDIRDRKLLTKSIENVDVVFHEAALANVTLSFENPTLTNDINVKGTLNLLEASSRYAVKRFVFASSAAVYGDPGPFKKREDMKKSPTSPYGTSKLTAERYARKFYRSHGLETISLRYFNIYGQRQWSNTRSTGVIPAFIARIMNDLPPIIHGDGEQTRDFVYVKDVVAANILALDSPDASGEAINVGTGIRTSINEIATSIKKVLKKEYLENIYVDHRAADVRHGYADITKAARILNFSPRFTIENGLTELVVHAVGKDN